MFNLSKQNWSGLPLPLLLGSCCILELGELHHSWWWDQGRGFWGKEEAGRSESKRQQKSTLLWELEKKNKNTIWQKPCFPDVGLPPSMLLPGFVLVSPRESPFVAHHLLSHLALETLRMATGHPWCSKMEMQACQCPT